MKIEHIKVGMKVAMCVPEGESCYYGRAGISTGEVGVVQSVYQQENLVMVFYPDWKPLSKVPYDWCEHTWKGKDYEFTAMDEWWDIWTN